MKNTFMLPIRCMVDYGEFMRKSSHQLVALLAAIVTAAMTLNAVAASNARPNLVVFISDDHGYLDSSVVGAPEFQTPNLERLAKAGMAFTHAFASSPACAPSRASLLTGMMPARSGSMLNHQPPHASLKKLPAYLQEIGYEVVAFGKVAHYDQGKDYGFDRISHDSFHDDDCVAAAVDFLEHRNDDEPLCILVGTNWPHVPWPKAAANQQTTRYKPPQTHVDTPETRRWRARYAAAVERFDRDLGQVYDTAFEKLGRNTLFLHFSDHGAQWPFGKWNLYDAGTRVPFFAVWPGVIAPGSRSDAMLSLVDVLPTIVEAAGGHPPKDIDGRSFANVFTGKGSVHRDRIFTTHSGDGRMNAYPIRSVRTHGWKYIRNLQPDGEHHSHIDRGKAVDGNTYWKSWVEKAQTESSAAATIDRYYHRPAEELYDLQADPHEQHNLASDPRNAKTLAQLRSDLNAWMRKQGDDGIATEKTVATEFQQAQSATAIASLRPNVLFIAIDDLRPQLGCYGHNEMITPSLDRLASEGRRFNHHYVQVPTCGASRCALLTGQYPARPEAYDNGAFGLLQHDDANRPATLPQLFKQNGYTTVSIGKITHSPDGRRGDGSPELPSAWDELGMPHGEWKDAWAAFFAYAGGKTRIIQETPVFERLPLPDNAYPDALIADAAIGKLRQLKSQPFFLAVGFIKPHLPFNAPQKYWDLYDPNLLPPPKNSNAPKNVDPAIGLHNSGEMRGQYTGFSEPGIVTDAEARNLRHAYRACVSYVDAQVGRMLQELTRLGLDDNTIVIVWGDHGWHLGEQGVWGKHTLHEVALRSPLLLRIPKMAAPGEAAEGFVESVDIYPTLAELCDLPTPSALNGTSFASMLRDAGAPGKSAVVGFWRGGRGHTIRTPRFRFTLWTNRDDNQEIVQTELYDHQLDPLETVNIAADHPQVVKKLSKQLRQTVPLLREP